jgi:hypothetical protein
MHGLDALDARVADFDWDGLSRALGEPGEISDHDLERLGQALRAVLSWILIGAGGRMNADDRRAGRRVLALAWVLDPSMIEGTPSLAKIARDCGVTRACMSLASSDATRRFGLVNRGQAHGWNRKGARSGASHSPTPAHAYPEATESMAGHPNDGAEPSGDE